MLKNFRDKIAFSGISVLIIGIVLLIFTFISAYGFLTTGLSIISSQDLVQTFGEALAPLIATCIRVMYLGVMGWVGSIITIRGVTIIAHTPQAVAETPSKSMAPELRPQQQPQPQSRPQAQTQPQQQQKPKADQPKEEKPKDEKPKEANKPSEPEIIVMPPQKVGQPQPQPNPPQQPSS